MASPRRRGGNQPTTTRPLAALLLAAAIPPSKKKAPSGRRPGESTAPQAVRAVRPSPQEITHRSPRRSARCPHTIRVRTIPTVGAAARTPGPWARDKPRCPCSSGIRKAGALTKTVPEACASTPRASMIHGLTPDMPGAGCGSWVRAVLGAATIGPAFLGTDIVEAHRRNLNTVRTVDARRKRGASALPAPARHQDRVVDRGRPAIGGAGPGGTGYRAQDVPFGRIKDRARNVLGSEIHLGHGGALDVRFQMENECPTTSNIRPE